MRRRATAAAAALALAGLVAGNEVHAAGTAAASSEQSDHYSRFVRRGSHQKTAGVRFCSWFSFACSDSGPIDRSFALVIGISDYRYLDKLRWSATDVDRMTEYLLVDAGFAEVAVLRDSDATVDATRHFMVDYFPNRLRGGSGRFVFYFSGHGETRWRGEVREEGYLRLADNRPGRYRDAIAMSRIHDWARNVSAARHTLFVIDACVSGLAGVERKRGLSPAVTVRQLMRHPGHHLLTAGGADEDAWSGPRWDGSLFTAALLHGLRTGAADLTGDNLVTVSELHTYTAGVVAKASGGAQTPQVRRLVTFRDLGELFFLSPRAAPAE